MRVGAHHSTTDANSNPHPRQRTLDVDTDAANLREAPSEAIVAFDPRYWDISGIFAGVAAAAAQREPSEMVATTRESQSNVARRLAVCGQLPDKCLIPG